MGIKFSVAVRNARLDAIETAIGASAILKIFTGAQPANTAAADSGSLLVEASLPSDYMAAASGGSKVKAGTWNDLAANGAGDAGHWRLYASDGTTCHMQGNCGGTGSGEDMELDNINIAVGQTVTITSWSLTDGNA